MGTLLWISAVVWAFVTGVAVGKLITCFNETKAVSEHYDDEP